MSQKTLKFDNIMINQKEFHKCKQPIDLDLVNADKIVISNKLKNSDDSFKSFIGWKKMILLNSSVLSCLIWVNA